MPSHLGGGILPVVKNRAVEQSLSGDPSQE